MTQPQLTILNSKNYLKQWKNLTGTGQDYARTHPNDLIKELTVRVMRKSGKSDQEIANFLGKSITPPKSYKGINWVDDGTDYTFSDKPLILRPKYEAHYESIRLIVTRNDDVSLIAKNMSIPEHIVQKVKQHFFINEHLISLDNKLLKGVFNKDAEEIAIWKAAIENGLRQDVRYFSLDLGDFNTISQADANFLFKRFIAHEYIESKLMQKGYMYNSLKGRASSDFTSVNFGGHDLSINAGLGTEEFLHWNGANFAKKPITIFGNDYLKLDLIVDEILNILE